ncbi:MULTISPECIES: class I SAM-dependent methyltransferase [unclassified Mycobacterium]|uniref:class I SAM-dependent methyltransferase n=1 Tax=unclassified Mycobacterium TaxID=2642494 RepID=UPI001483307C|nr:MULTISPECIES: class I SAM-dependent methyltransferase [unclassified Mycobacterium]
MSLAVLDELDPWRGRSLLDIGCGDGDFTNLASCRGATVTGLDACPALVEVAQKKTPSGSFEVGDMEDLPFPDGAFTVVTAFNCLHFASEPACAIDEAIRVMRPDGYLVLATWGPPNECDAITYLLDLGGLLPPEISTASTPLDASDPHALDVLVTRAGLALTGHRVVSCPWEYTDLGTALRGLLSTGPAALAINHAGRDRVATTIAESIAPYRRNDGSYVLENTCHYLVARH